MWYHFHSSIGLFWIRPQPNREGSYWLGLDDMPLMAYASPEAAAEAVYQQKIGFAEWDDSIQAQAPKNLLQWTPGKPEQL